VQKYLRVKMVGPLDHRCVKVWMRDCNRANAAARVDFGSGLVVEERNAIPEQVSRRGLQEQSALAYRKFRFCADPEKPWRFLFESVMVISRQLFERRPFLASVTNKLPFILANRTAWRRLRAFSKLRSALDADRIFHSGTVCRDDLPGKP
jgi:hypothetical protein